MKTKNELALELLYTSPNYGVMHLIPEEIGHYIGGFRDEWQWTVSKDYLIKHFTAKKLAEYVKLCTESWIYNALIFDNEKQAPKAIEVAKLLDMYYDDRVLKYGDKYKISLKSGVIPAETLKKYKSILANNGFQIYTS